MKPFLITYGLFVLIVSTLLVIYPKPELFALLNGAYSDFGNQVFPFITHLGDGFLSGLVVVFLLFISYRWAIISSVSFIVTGLITQLLKHTLFADCLRPMKFFADNEVVHTVTGVEMHMYNSFPSGHSAMAFSLFFMLSLALSGKKPVLGIVFFALALLGGYSRIYLGHHFPEDILAGSAIGVVITCLCYRLIDKLLKDKDWATQALFKKGITYE